ncbi:MAG: DNA gyrase/topoisomerase IV subunit A [Bacteroidales bacterium]|nr:DNA gyrase/topoisomerase IV subunit A [Bacteroidales bacterium]
MEEQQDDIVTPEEIESEVDSSVQNIRYIGDYFQDWFLDYASYVITDRAIPYLEDGLKPVQRRVLYTMKKMDDGRYNKVASIVGETMKLHPHGDAGIYDALVGLGQKDLLIDTQGNWGNIFTGDGAAAGRYIEARLSKFALEVLFNAKTTEWVPSYDGRNKEPVTLPVKFPLLLLQGIEGIAVGMACKVLPHNFNELIDASIAYLKNEPFELFPDFPTGGLIDVSKYNDGQNGGRVRVRARINKVDNKTLMITEIPYGETTSSIIDSILKANEEGKIKIKHVDDDTSATAEILISLPANVSADETIDALYVFTKCGVSISPNTNVICNQKPVFLGVSDILRKNTDRTVELLRRELEINLEELKESWMKTSLEKIFIENEVYEKIKPCKTEEDILTTIDKGLKPYVKDFWREVTREDCVALSNIPIKKISKYNSFKTDEYIRSLEVDMEEVKNNLEHLVEYAIRYYEHIKEKYGAGKERKSEIRNFEQIEVSQVVNANTKLYANYETGFVGTSLKKDDFVCDCSDLDDIIVFLQDGRFRVSKVKDKDFFGVGIIHIGVFRKNDERTVYNVAYRDGKTNVTYIKRFPVTGVIRDNFYNLTLGTPKTKVLYFSANPNGEAEIVKVYLRQDLHLRKPVFEVDFSSLTIKGKNSKGNILTKHPAFKIIKIEEGVSTLGGRKIYFNEETKRLNDAGYGTFLGEFKGSDKILVITEDGKFALSTFDLSNHFEYPILRIEKYDERKIWTAIVYDAEQDLNYIKRFKIEETSKYVSFLPETDGSKLIKINDDRFPQLCLSFGGKHANRDMEYVDVDEFIGVKGYKAKGKRISNYTIDMMEFVEPLEKEIPEEEQVASEPVESNDVWKDNTDTLDSEDPVSGEQMSLF